MVKDGEDWHELQKTNLKHLAAKLLKRFTSLFLTFEPRTAATLTSEVSEMSWERDKRTVKLLLFDRQYLLVQMMFWLSLFCHKISLPSSFFHWPLFSYWNHKWSGHTLNISQMNRPDNNLGKQSLRQLTKWQLVMHHFLMRSDYSIFTPQSQFGIVDLLWMNQHQHCVRAGERR